MYRFAWHLLLPIRRLLYWLVKECIRLFILFLIVVSLYFLFFSGKAGAQEPDFNFGKVVSLPGFRSIQVPGGWDNSCSQYVVASLLSALGKKVDKPLFDAIGQAINPNQTGAFTSDVESYLRTWFDCERLMPATIHDVVQHLDRGLPVVASVRVTPPMRHLVIINGYEADPDGNIKDLSISDNGLLRGTYSPEEFLRIWRFADEPTFDSYCLLISPNDKTPDPEPLVLEDNIEPVSKTPSPGIVQAAVKAIEAKYPML